MIIMQNIWAILYGYAVYFTEEKELIQLLHDTVEIPFTSIDQSPHLQFILESGKYYSNKFLEHFQEVEENY